MAALDEPNPAAGGEFELAGDAPARSPGVFGPPPGVPAASRQESDFVGIAIAPLLLGGPA